MQWKLCELTELRAVCKRKKKGEAAVLKGTCVQCGEWSILANGRTQTPLSITEVLAELTLVALAHQSPSPLMPPLAIYLYRHGERGQVQPQVTGPPKAVPDIAASDSLSQEFQREIRVSQA